MEILDRLLGENHRRAALQADAPAGDSDAADPAADGDSAEGLLEKANLLDAQALVHFFKGELPWALQCCNESLELLDLVEQNESEPDLETERSGILATRAQILAAQGEFADALRDCERAVEIEGHRAQEGYDASSMWQAIHLSTKASIHRLSGDWKKGLEIALGAIELFAKMPTNQQAHLGASLARMHFEVGQCQADGSAAVDQNDAAQLQEEALKSLSCAAGLLESEMLQGKTHLISQLIEVYTHWLELQRKMSSDEAEISHRWSRFFDSWSSWENFLDQESRSDFLKKSLNDLRQWAQNLNQPGRSLWAAKAPNLLKEHRRKAPPASENPTA